MLLISVHRVLDRPACSVDFSRDQPLQDAFPRVSFPPALSLGYHDRATWPHPGDPRDLALFIFETLSGCEERIGQWGGWPGLV